MDSIGEKLKSARETKKLSIKDVVRDTNITPLYITALEEEDFDKFPSETYLIGFLRSYSEYLKLDSEEIIQSYRGYKIGESVTPLEELTRPTRTSFSMLFSTFTEKYKNFLFAGLIVAAVVFIVWGINAVISAGVDTGGASSIESIKQDYNSKNAGEKIDNIRNLQLHNDRGFILVYKNEAVQFLVGNKEVVFILREINEGGVKLEFLPEKQEISIDMEKTRNLTMDNCPREILFTLKGLTENRAKIMVLLGKKIAGEDEPKNLEKKEDLSDNTDVVAQNEKNLKIIFEAEFDEKSFIDIYLDGVRKKRGFIPRGTVERWEASEIIQVKIGNAGGLKARINNRDYTFGKSGQVANKVIKWKKDINNPNLYHIVVQDW